MADELILAHDLGTSSDKACLFDVHGNFLAEAYHQYPVYYPEQGWAEQNPRDWWEAVKVTSREVMKKADVEACDVKAISFSAHGMGVIPVDKSGELLCERTMVWMDARSTKEAKQILEQTGIREHYDKTGNSFDMALYPAAKILWIKRNMPDVYKKTYKFLGTKEYLIHKMTGVISHTDYTEVGLSGFYNLHTHEFDEELLRASEVDEHKLPEAADVTKVMGELTAAAAAEMGLAAGTPVVLGSWDNFACATGGGGRTKGNMVAYLGTAGWLGATHNQPLMSEDFMSNVVYVGEGTYFTTAHSNSACASYEWVIDNACGYLRESENPYAEADRLAAEVCAGSDNLFFLPSFFSGNTFYSDASLRGGFLGISAGHTNGHIIRAAMEGVGFDLMMGADFFRSMGALPKEAVLIGGGAKSDLWRKILASMFGISLVRPKNLQHIGALGAAIYAGVGTGLMPNFEYAARIIRSDDVTEPMQSEMEVYRELLPIFCDFYESLIPIYRKLAGM